MRRFEAYYADGEWRPATGEQRHVARNPASDEAVAEAVAASAQDVDRAVRSAQAAGRSWRLSSGRERLDVLSRLHDAITARAEEMAASITEEMGCPIGFSRAAQIGMPLRNLQSTMRALERVEDEVLGSSVVTRDAVGVVAAITPWNFPLHQIIAKLAPAIAAGCTVVLKPSEVTPSSAAILVEAVEAAAVPPGVFNLVFGGPETGEHLVSHPAVRMVSFTGSTRGGRRVAELAAKDLKKIALELGGKSANILLEDADLARAIPAAVAQCFVNSGQTCAALTRLLCPQSRLSEVEELAVQAAQGWTVGDPHDPAARLGPLASRVQQDRVRAYIDGAVEEGAALLLGGSGQPEGLPAGAYVSPTVLGRVTNEMTVAREEVFGPVLAIISYRDEAEAVAIANDSDYGLSGGVWSADRDRALAVARRLETGQVVINGGAFDIEAPFGGVKCSGVGREYGRYGLEEFFALKALVGAAPAGSGSAA